MAGQKRLIFVPLALLAVLAGLTVYMAVRQSAASRASQNWVSHTYQVIDANQRLFVGVLDAENSVRAFVLTKDASYRRAYDTAAGAIDARLKELEALVADNPPQAVRAAGLRNAVAVRLATLQTGLELAQAGQDEAAVEAIQAGRNGDQVGPARSLAREIGQAERQLLAERSRRLIQEEQRGYMIAASLSLLVLIALGGALMVLIRSNRALRREVVLRKQAEAAARQSGELIQTVFNNTPEYLALIDVQDDGQFTVADVNPAFEAATKVKAGRLRGREVRDAFGADGDTAHAAYLQVVREGVPLSVVEPVQARAKSPMTWETRLAPVRDAAGRIARIVVSSRDITEREALEAQLRRAQRMEAVGQLTGGVAHDFNNLLQVIRANLEMIAPVLADNPTASRRLRNAIHGADRAAQLTRQMLAFARRQPLEPKVVNLGRMVSDMAEMMRRTIGETVEIQTVIAGGLWNTIADPAQVESAVLNLAINARDAMPGGGRLTIELANATLDETYARQNPDVSAGQYVMLAVSDTGQGMSPEVAARVFEPFFTTKPDGKGTGLGLSMVYGFVKQSNGHVQIYSEPGSGTTVKIYLPRSRKAADQADEIATAPARDGDSIVLVVEDEAAVRAAAVAMLEDLGYRCLQAADAQSALEILKGDSAIDLLFTDVIMPGPLKTRDLVAQVAALRPDLPVLYTSGYTENAIDHHGRLDAGVSLLSKPYGREDLARKVGQLLART